MNFTNNGGVTLGSITAGTLTLSENAANATISQASGATINLGAHGTLTLNGAATKDTTYTLTNGNTVGMLVANLGAGGGTLSYTDNTTSGITGASYRLGNITAGSVTLNESASGAVIAQAASTTIDLGTGMLTLNGASSIDTNTRSRTATRSARSRRASDWWGFVELHGCQRQLQARRHHGRLRRARRDGRQCDNLANGGLQAINLSLSGTGASYTLASAMNRISTLFGNTGAITLTDAAAGGLTLGSLPFATGITTTGDVSITNTGTLTLAKTVSSQAAGDAIVLSSGAIGTAFTVDAGATLSATNGRFLVFTDAVGDVSGSTLGANPFYGVSFAQFSANPATLDAHAGNRFVYAQSETLTVTPSAANTTTVTYDGATQTAPSNDVASPSRASSAPMLRTRMPSRGTAGVTGGSGRNVGTYAFTADVSGLTSDFGYQFQAGSGGGLVITKAALTVSAVTTPRSMTAPPLRAGRCR